MGSTAEMKKALKGSGGSSAPEPSAPSLPRAAYPAYCSIPDWGYISGMGRRKTYDAIATGVLRAKKFGASTLVDVQHGLAVMECLPNANFKPMKRQQAA
jgi:hypothetical protein